MYCRKEAILLAYYVRAITDHCYCIPVRMDNGLFLNDITYSQVTEILANSLFGNPKHELRIWYKRLYILVLSQYLISICARDF